MCVLNIKPAMTSQTKRFMRATDKKLKNNRQAIIGQVHDGGKKTAKRFFHDDFVSTLLKAVELGSLW